MPLRARQPDVEQTPFLRDVAAPHRQLALLDARQEDGLPLEPLRAVECQQVDTASRARTETLVQQLDEVLDLAVELLCQPDEPRQVRLPRLLALAELLGHLGEEPLADRELAHDLAGGPPPAAERLQQLASRVARQQRRALERDPGVVERLLE